MVWKEISTNLSYVFLGLTIPSLGVFIYKKVAEPISLYVVNGSMKINEEEYNNVFSENGKLIDEIEKLQKIVKVKGDR